MGIFFEGKICIISKIRGGGGGGGSLIYQTKLMSLYDFSPGSKFIASVLLFVSVSLSVNSTCANMNC